MEEEQVSQKKEQKKVGAKTPKSVTGILGVGKDRDYFIEQLSVLLSSGMDLLAALSSIKEEVSSNRMKRELDRIYRNVEAGMPLWKALEISKVMPSYFVSLVKIGESSGMLVENLKVVSLQYQKDKSFKARVASAMVYPVFVLVITLVVGLATAILVLPRITGVYERMSVELNVFTNILIGAGNFFQNFGAVVVPVTATLVVALVYFMFFYTKTKHTGEAVLLRTPGVRQLIIEVELSRFGYILGNLLKSGVPVVDSLELLASLTSFRVYREFYKNLRSDIKDGMTFKESFEKIPKAKNLMPSSFQRLVISGEQSGGLSNSLIRMSAVYEEKIEVTSRNLTVVLEPVMLVLVWLGVVVVALGVITPMYGLIGNISNQTNPERNSDSKGTVVVQEENGGGAADELDETAYVYEDVENVGTGEGEGEVGDVGTSEEESRIEIKSTGTGFLNVRTVPGGPVTATVKPGDVYVFVDYLDGWYQIVLEDGSLGWVSEEFVNTY